MRCLGRVALWLLFAVPFAVYALGIAAPDAPGAGLITLPAVLVWATLLTRFALGQLKEPAGDSPSRWWRSKQALLAAGLALVAVTGWTLLNSSPWRFVRPEQVSGPMYPLLHWLAPETTPAAAQVCYVRIGGEELSGGARVSPAFSQIDSLSWSPDGKWLVFRGHRYVDRSGDSQGWYYLARARGGRARLLMRPPEHASGWSCYWSPNGDEICFLDQGNLSNTTLVSVPDGGKRVIGLNPPAWWPRLPGLTSGTVWASFPPGPYPYRDRCAWVSREPLSPLGRASKPFVFLLGGVAAPLLMAAALRSLQRSRLDRPAWVALACGALVWATFALGTLSYLLRALFEGMAHIM